ncbi:MAG: beta-lactamase family protein [Gemmatimonadales bacterium]|nr:beta-lactamase family protein [Gemmatimonadales bacterium]
MPIARRSFLAATAGVGFAVVGLPRRTDNRSSIARLVANTPYWLEATRTPGIAIGLVEDGRVRDAIAIGFDAPGAGKAITKSTVFQGASLSKQAMAWIALKSIEAGKLDLDRPLVAYIASPPDAPEAGMDRITARHVLTHTTGWPNWPPNDGPFRSVRPLGTWGYSGAGFLLLQQALEGAWSEPAVSYTRRLLLDPLGMTSSSFVWRAEYDATATRGYQQDGSPAETWQPDRPNGASSLHTTPEDYSRLLAGFLTPSVRTRFPTVYQRQVAIDARLGWSLGWGTDGDVLWQWGHSNGFRTFAALDPRRRRGIVSLSNGAGGQRVNREWVNGWLERDLDAFFFSSVEL